jgi:hypothetical protein
MPDTAVDIRQSTVSGRGEVGGLQTADGGMKRESLKLKPGGPFGKGPACGEGEGIVQKKEASGQNTEVTPDIESSISALKGSGQPLSESSRSFFEPRLGADFSDVRLHSDSRAGKLADILQAKAFTVGRTLFSELNSTHREWKEKDSLPMATMWCIRLAGAVFQRRHGGGPADDVNNSNVDIRPKL